MSVQFNLPSEVVELPSKGLLYEKTSPLAKGVVELKYMTAKEEDILTNTNFISKGIVVDKLLESMIVTKGINYNDILIGDKNAIMIAARILAYGKNYRFNYGGKTQEVDLTQLKNKNIDYSVLEKGVNEFEFTLPKTENKITFKLLNHGDHRKIEEIVEGYQKITTDNLTEVTSRFKVMITSVNSSREVKDINTFVDNYFLSLDAKALRKYYDEICPDVDMTFTYVDDLGKKQTVDLPFGIPFFWPED